MIRGNPEFVKNVKLEFNLMRFVTALVLLFLMIWIGWNAQEKNWERLYTAEQIQAKELFSWLCGFGFMFSIVWGTYLATNSLLDEMKTKTWDFVRMSSLSPLKILTGKMFGATSLIWVVTMLGVMPGIFYAVTRMLPEGGIVRPEIITVSVLMICLVAWIVLSYALTVLMGLADGAQNRGGSFSGTLLVFLLGTMIGIQIMEAFTPFHSLQRYGEMPSYHGGSPTREALPAEAFIVKPDFSYIKKPDTSDWYGFELYNLDMLALVLVFFCLWAFTGAWRTLRRSLQYHDAPWVWIFFILTASAFLSGFDFLRLGRREDVLSSQSAYFWPVFISAACLFFTCITEAGNTVKYRSFFQKLSTRLYSQAFRAMPLWLIAFVIFSISVLLNLLAFSHSKEAALFFISLMAFTVRDVLAFHAIAWAPNSKRPLVGLVVYLAIFYGLLPAVADSMGDNSSLFFPLISDAPPDLYWLVLAAEILVAGYFLVKRWKILFGRKEASVS